MDLALLKRLQDERAKLLEAQRAALNTAETEKRDLSDAENTEYEARNVRITEIDERVAELAEQQRRADESATSFRTLLDRKPVSVTVVSEPMTYQRGNGKSYFLDLAKAQFRNDTAAAERLGRHAAELRVELPARETRREERARQQADGLSGELRSSSQQRESMFEKRVNPSRTDGQGGYFVPPLWLVDEYIDLPRFGRTIANSVRNMTLPDGTDSINLPKIATGTATAVQTSDGAPVQSTDLTDTFVNAPVRTEAGQQDVAMQLLDQSPVSFDEITFTDLIADYNQKIDLQVINGSGINGQALGMLNVSGINSVTSTAGSTTLITLYSPMLKLLSQIAKNRKMMPTALFMTPTRWFWAAAALDSQNRPLILPEANAPFNPMALQTGGDVEGPVGRLLSTPILADGNIPATLGGGTEDRIIAARTPDLYFWEGNLRTRVLTEVLSGTLQVRFQVYNYFAFMGNRRPESISVLSGSDLAASFTSGF